LVIKTKLTDKTAASWSNAGDPKVNRPLIQSRPGRNISSPGDFISAKCEMDSPGGEDISRLLVEKVAPVIKMSRNEKNVFEFKA